MGVRKRVRCRKARLTTVCPECRAPIRVGELITSTAGARWVHAEHVIRRHAAAAAEAAP